MTVTPLRGSQGGEAPSWQLVDEYIPPEYVIQKEGVFINKKDKEQISGPCWVTALTRSSQGTEWGLVIHWIDQDNKEQHMAFPVRRLLEPRSPLASDLVSFGLKVVPGKERRLMSYLGSFDLPKHFRLRSVSLLGWLDGDHETPLFVLPNRKIGIGDTEDVVFQPEEHSPSTKTMHRQGTLEHWRTHIAEPCAGNPLLIFSLCTAFAGCLLKFANLDSGGFHIYGSSSKGKTTALQVAASVWGCGADPAISENSYIGRWNTTGNALEAIAAAHNDNLLTLDEMGTCSSRDFGKVVYDLFGGKGKSRLNKNSALQAQRAWRILGLSTGEISVLQKIEEDSGRKAKTGQLIRLVDIPIDKGVIQDSHGRADGDFVNQLKKACSTYYGSAGSAFLENLVKTEIDILSLRRSIQELVDESEKSLIGKRCLESHQHRVIRRFALVCAAGKLATEFEILPFKITEVEEAMEGVRDAWLGDDNNKPEAIRGIENVIDFLLRNEARFRYANDRSADIGDIGTDKSTQIRDIAGYTSGHDKDKLFLFNTKVFRQEVCAGISHLTVLEELDKRGHLFKNERDRKESRHKIKGMGRPRLYAVKASILNDEDLK